MELEGDAPAPRPTPAPEPTPTQNLQVTPENVVALAAMFTRCADRLNPVVRHLDVDMRLKDRWMDDPVSEWVRQRFNEYFADGENSFAKVVQAEFDQHVAMAKSLTATALRYGLTDELNAAGLIKTESTE